MRRVLVVNPNSNEEVTEGIRAALADLGPEISCMTLAEGPSGIETRAHVEAVIAPLRDIAARTDAGAMVIACYSDPGIAECRAATATPVFGIQESAVRRARRLGGRFGLVALGPASIERHMPYMAALGALEDLAGARPLHMSVDEGESPAAFPRILEVATALRDEDGARAIVLGCAGMSRHRAPLERALGIPVIDPTRAAAEEALAAVRPERGSA